MDLKRLLDNRTPMVIDCALLDDRHGREQVVIFAKMSWQVSADGKVSIAASQSPIRLQGISQPFASDADGREADEVVAPSLRYPEELSDEVPGTDVILVGTAYPQKVRDTAVEVKLEVADSRARRLLKTVRVSGPRVWRSDLVGVSPGPPGALEPTPLSYENAYGGRDDSDPQEPLVEERNPVGSGIAKKRASLVGAPAPALEDPNHPLNSRNPAPAAFAPIPSHWQPRSARCGSYDDNWRRQRAPLRPIDFDPRANNTVPDDQHCDEPLAGDEMYGILGVLSAGRAWRFRLPQYRPTFFAKLRNEHDRKELATHLDTVIIDADEQRVELLWRACTPLPMVPQMLEFLLVASRDKLPHEIEQQVLAIARQEQTQ